MSDKNSSKIPPKILQIGLIIVCLTSIIWLNSIDFAIASESAQQRHVLSRLTFGVTSSETARLENMGFENYIQSQLDPSSIDESSKLEDYLDELDLVNRDLTELSQQNVALRRRARKPDLPAKQKQKARKAYRNFTKRLLDESGDAHLARAIFSERQLQEVMVDFWFNHFNVHAQKGDTKVWVNDYEDRIRTHALGNFYDLLLATAKHPAMLVYLDNKDSTAPNSPAGKKNQRGLNENYAREVMELHTLGIDGGYTQDDVIALAKILTGWTIDRDGKHGSDGFYFNPRRHDPEDKVFLGRTITANGVREGEEALQILASHPATAQSIGYKLAQYFVADEPPTSLVNLLAQKFANSRGDIKLVLDTLIHSSEFNDPQYYGQKFKTPYQYLASLVRMGEIKDPDLKRVRGMLYQLSMPVFQCVTPNGYKNIKAAWLNPQAMLQRVSLATAISRGVLDENSKPKRETVEQNMGQISAATKQVVDKTSSKGLGTALIMGSPEAMYR